MNPKSFLSSFLAISGSALLLATQAHSTPLYWDTNGTGTAGSGAATGTWGTSVFWSTDSTGANVGSPVLTATTISADDLFFSAGTNGTLGTVTVSGTQSAHSITFDDAVAITLSGGTAINLGSATAGSGLFFTGNAANTISTGIILDSAATAIAISNSTASLQTIGAITGSVTTGTQTLTVGSSSTGGITLGSISDGTAGGNVALTVNSSGAGVVTLSGTNTYTGTTIISAGTLSIASSITNGAAVLGTGGITLSQGATLAFNPTSNGTQALTNAITLSGGAGTANIKLAGNDKNLFLSGNVTGQAGVAQTLAITEGSSVGAGDRQNIRFSGIIADGASGGTLGLSIDFAGASTASTQNAFVNLTGQNTFTGNLTVTNSKSLAGGTPAGAWVTIGGERVNGGTLTPGTGYLGGGDYSGTISLSNGTSGLTTLSFLTSANQILRGAISGTGSFRQDGTGTLTLTSNSNSYTGTTTVTAGLLRVDGSLAAGSAVTVSGGALGGTGTVNGAVTVSGTGGVNLGNGAVGNLTLGSTLDITGSAGANNLSFDLGNTTNTTDKLIVGGATSVTNAGAAVISLNQLGGAAGRNAAGTYTLIQGTTSMAALGQFALATTNAFGQTFVLGVTGNNLELTTTQVTAQAGSAAAFWSGATSINWSDATNWKNALAGSALTTAPDYQSNVTFSATGAGNLTSNVLDVDFDINSLNFNALTGGVTIGGTKMLTIEGVTGVNGNAANNGINSANTSGTNTISSKVGLASSQTWTVGTGGTLAVSGVVSDFGGGYALTKAGAGTLTLSGANTYSGGTVLSAGTIAISNATSLGSGAVSVTGNSRINAAALTYTNAISIASGTVLTLQAAGANGTTSTFSGDISGLGGITIAQPPAGSSTTINLSSTNNTFTGNLTLGTATLNDFTNFASIGDGGTIVIGKATWRGVVAYTGSANLTLNNRTLTVGTGLGFASGLDGGGNPINIFENNGAGTVTFNAANMGVTTTSSNGFFWFGGSNTGNNTFAGAIADSSNATTLGIGKWGAGKWILSNNTNSYEGNAWIADGTLSVSSIADANTNQALGRSALIVFGNGSTGTLELTGSGTSTTNKQVQLGNATAANTGSGTILNNGAGTLTFNNTTFNTTIAGITAARTLTLGGTNTGANTISGIIQNNAAAGLVALSKIDAGTWVLSGNNTYSGGTTLSAGTLNINASGTSATNSAIGTGTFTISGGTIDNTSAGTVTLATNNVLALNGNFTYTGSNNLNLGNGNVSTNAARSITVSANTLTIGGTFTSGGVITKLGNGTLSLSGTNSANPGMIVTAGTLNLTNTNTFGAGNITVANTTANAVLNVSAGANITLSGNGSSTGLIQVGTVSGANGALNIIGGSLTTTPSTDHDNNFLIGSITGGYGSLTMTGGTAQSRRVQIGGGLSTAGTGVALISGGTFTSTGFLLIARQTSAIGVLTVASGGTVNHLAVGGGAATQHLSLAYSGGRGELNLTGGTLNSTGKSLYISEGNTAGATGIINLNAGTLTVDSFVKTNGTAYLNFNGGTLKAGSADSAIFVPNTMTGVYINSGGAVIDTNTRAVTITANLLAPTGNGLSALPVATKGSGYIGAPYVSVSGTGFGATAIAEMEDDGTGNGTFRVKSIIITNPGNNYTGTPTFTLTGGGATTAATLGTATIVANTSGGLTKTNTGTLTLSGAGNTYTGLTTISAGKLSMASNLIGTSSGISIGNTAIWESTGGLILTAGQSVTGTGATGFVTTTPGTGLSAAGNNIISSSGVLTLTRLSVLGTGNQITGGDIQSGGAGVNQRGLIVGSGASGALTISGGSLTSNGGSTNIDILGNGASTGNGTLIINGGSYVNTASTGTLNLGFGSASGTLTVTAGSATINTLVYNAGTTGTQTSAIVNLDGGTLTVSNITVTSGTTKVFNFNGGQFVAGASLPAFSGLTLNVKNGGAKIDTGVNSFTISDALLNAGSGGLTKTGAGTLTLSNVSNTYTGVTTVTSGALIVNGSIASSSVVVTGSLGGSGVMANATISGSGSINPGNSPGILTAAATNPTGGLDYNFEFTQANVSPTWNAPTNSVNDVLRLTSGTPFTAAMDNTNLISLYLNVGSLTAGDVFTGGIYTDNNATFLTSISSASYQYLLLNNATGAVIYQGIKYDVYTGPLTFNVATVSQTADFGAGNISGYVTQFTVIPEPRTALLGCIGVLLLLRRRR